MNFKKNKNNSKNQLQLVNFKNIYKDLLVIRNKIRAPLKYKLLMLGSLLTQNKNSWRIVGITKEALIVFSKHNFKYATRMGINRSHFVNRAKTYTRMLTGKVMPFNKWLKFYLDNDKTILATSSENLLNKFSKTYKINTNNNLFIATGYRWRHTSQETNSLKIIHKKIIKK
jgi:hypothetical protein